MHMRTPQELQANLLKNEKEIYRETRETEYLLKCFPKKCSVTYSGSFNTSFHKF